MVARNKSHYNPLDFIPSPEVIEEHLAETETLAERLRILLRVSREIAAARPTTDNAGREAANA